MTGNRGETLKDGERKKTKKHGRRAASASHTVEELTNTFHPVDAADGLKAVCLHENAYVCLNPLVSWGTESSRMVFIRL